MNKYTTPPSTPQKPQEKCPLAPKRYNQINRSIPLTPLKGPLFDENKDCPWAPKKRGARKYFFRIGDERVRIFFPSLLLNDNDKSCKKRLFTETPSKIPTLIKKVKTSSKFADSLKRKINASRRR